MSEKSRNTKLCKISAKEIQDEIERHKKQELDFYEKLALIYNELADKLETGKYPFLKEIEFSDTIDGDSQRYVSKYMKISGKKKKKTYNQEILIGYNSDFYRLKKNKTPEIGIYFYLKFNNEEELAEIRNKILSDKIFYAKIKSLKNYGFEINLNIKDNQCCHYLFYIRKSLDEFDFINTKVLYDFIEETFEIIYKACLNEHIFFTELS